MKKRYWSLLGRGGGIVIFPIWNYLLNYSITVPPLALSMFH